MDIKKLINEMTLEEKCSLLSGYDFWQSKPLEKYGIKKMFLSDGPSGVRKQATASDHLGLNESLKSTCFPTSGTLANSWDPELAFKVGEQLGKEAKHLNINVLLAPGINIKRNPLCGRNFEYYSEDPYLAGKIASGFIKGLQSNNISACVKHFAVNNQETQRIVMNTLVDERTLRELYLTAFEIVVDEAKPQCLMTSYNLLNGEYTNENKHLLLDILRSEWKYNGLVVTDWGGDNDRISGLKCSNDLEMPSTYGETDKEIIEAVKNGTLDIKYVDDAVSRILTIYENTKSAFDGEDNFVIEDSLEVARKAAEESIVLLKNLNNILPLDTKSKIALIGDFGKYPRYQGSGSSLVNPHKETSLLDAIQESKEINFIGYEKGFDRHGKKNTKLLKNALELASKAEIIIYCFGLDEWIETEGIDRSNIFIRQNQIDVLKELRKLNKPIIGVSYSGSAIDLSYDSNFDALVQCSLLGETGGYATYNVLTGKVNPSGKLSESYPICYDDCSTSDNYPGSNRETTYKEGLYVGYRYYDKANVKTKYCFGYGLSYTSFAYSDLEVNPTCVKFKLTNTGKFDGKETAMLFIGLDNSALYRPVKELKGFNKVFLNAGETKEINIPFDKFSFRTYDVSKNKFVYETGDYKIYVGTNVEDIKLVGEIHIDGEEISPIVNKNDMQHLLNADVKNISKKEIANLFKGTYINPLKTKYLGKHILVDYNTTVEELKDAKGLFGRLLYSHYQHKINFLNAIGKGKAANSIILATFQLPMRNLSRMSGGTKSIKQIDGLILMCNGHFFKGLKIYLKERRNFKKYKKSIGR